MTVGVCFFTVHADACNGSSFWNGMTSVAFHLHGQLSILFVIKPCCRSLLHDLSVLHNILWCDADMLVSSLQV